MKYSTNKELNLFVRDLVRQGWRFERRRKHGRLLSPAGGMVCVPSTPSDHRGFRNLKRDVERAKRGQDMQFVN